MGLPINFALNPGSHGRLGTQLNRDRSLVPPLEGAGAMCRARHPTRQVIVVRRRSR